MAVGVGLDHREDRDAFSDETLHLGIIVGKCAQIDTGSGLSRTQEGANTSGPYGCKGINTELIETIDGLRLR